MADAPWRPSRPTTILIGILTVWPGVYMCLFVWFIATAFGRPPALPDLFPYFIAVHLLTILLMAALMVVYIVHLFKTDLIPNDRKALWAVVIFFGSLISGPIYWYLYLWRNGTAIEPSQPA